MGKIKEQLSWMRFDNGQFLLGDCLELMKDIPSGSVDMILCDLPYGTTQNKWDSVIPFEPLWEQYWRIAKLNAAIVLTASQPFTTKLIASQIDRFKYCWVWDKVNQYTNHLNAKIQPMKRHEDICVFYAKQPSFNRQMVKRETPYISRKSSTNQGSSYGKMNKNDYGELRTKMPPCSILEVAARTPKTLHPTQKPVALFEYLIKTYTNPGETVLDNCAGSGTTAIAAERTGRKWICMEKDQTYYNSAIRRVAREYY